MKHESDLPPLATPGQLGEYLGIPPTTLAQWRWVRTGPTYVRLGRLIRYRREDVEEWLESNQEVA